MTRKASNNPSISVVIPTAGQRSLSRSLASLQAQDMPPAEVIVAWNTVAEPSRRADIEPFEARLPLRMVHEPVAGLNRARNAGCRAARGTIIALLDDDCAAGTDWLAAISASFERHPDAGICCGPVKLEFETTPPAWLGRPFTDALSQLDWGAHETELGPDEYVVGANMSFMTAMFHRLGGFDGRIGMVGTGQPQLANDEKSFVDNARTLATPGVWYAPRAVVHHWIPVERVTTAHLVSRRYGQGYSDAASRGEAAAKWQVCLDQFAAVRAVFHYILQDKRRDLGEEAGRAYGACLLRYELAYVTGALDEIRARPPRDIAAAMRELDEAGDDEAREAIHESLKMTFLADLDRLPGERQREAVFAAVERLYHG